MSFEQEQDIYAKLNSYLQDFNKVEGWFVKYIVDILIIIDSYQSTNQITGHLAEIGVFRGKSFIPLLALCKENEIALAIDCFEDTHFNRDGSGFGASVSRFLAVVNQYLEIESHRVKILQGDSLKFSAQDYLHQLNGGKARIFSIDGGHTAESTFDDMKKSYSCLEYGGVMIIDDFFNQSWPGVCEGVARYMTSGQVNIKPFFIGGNKVMFTHESHVEGYISAISDRMKPEKYSEFWGSKVMIFPRQ